MNADEPLVSHSCSRCGRTALWDSVEDAGQAFLCESCAALAVRNAKRRILWSHWIIAGILLLGLVVSVFGATVRIRPDRPFDLSPLDIVLIASVESVIAAYGSWSAYWGIPAAWKWWLRLSERMARRLGRIPFSRLVLPTVPLVLLFYIPLASGLLYGFFGGGFYEYAKCKRMASRLGAGETTN